MPPEQPARVAALLLAAGRARRFGSAKLLAGLDGVPLARHAALAAREAGIPITAVVPPDGAALAAAAGVPWIATPSGVAPGVALSIRTGLLALPPSTMAVLILLADMPRITPATLRQLAAALTGPGDIVVPVHRHQRGNPVGWGRDHWPALMALDGDRGGGVLLDGLAGHVLRVAVDDPGILQDVDTPAELERLHNQSSL
jgi:molybdenum cofactor cytidylyltransferase